MTRRRHGFTIIEILVALALTLFILTILSQAFVAGADTFRSLKAVGDLNESLRVAANMLRADLSADHFEGKRRLSDTKFWVDPVNNGQPSLGYFYVEHGSMITGASNTSPIMITTNGHDLRTGQQITIAGVLGNPAANGTFAVTVLDATRFTLNGSAGNGPYTAGTGTWWDATDADGLPTRRRTNHKLAMTVKARGNRPKDFFSVKIPAGPLAGVVIGNPDGRFEDLANNVISSQWAEVSYFLVPNGGTTDGANFVPLYALYRQQRVVWPGPTYSLNWGDPPGTRPAGLAIWPIVAVWKDYYQPRLSCRLNPMPVPLTGATNPPPVPANGALYFNTPADLTIPERRAAAKFPTLAQRYTPPARVDLPWGAPIFAGATFVPILDPTGSVLTGEDLLLTDVISFDVKVLTNVPPNLVPPLGTPPPPLGQGSTTEFGDLPPPYYFDTWSTRKDDAYDYSAPNPLAATNTSPIGPPVTVPLTVAQRTGPPVIVRVTAVQITLRIYDTKSRIARQISIIQDL